MQMYSAPSMNPQAAIRPAFTLQPMQRKTVRTVAVKDESGFHTKEIEEVIDGYMIRTMRGDSAFVTADEVRRMKYDRLIPLMKPGQDDPVGIIEQQVPIHTATGPEQDVGLVNAGKDE